MTDNNTNQKKRALSPADNVSHHEEDYGRGCETSRSSGRRDTPKLGNTALQVREPPFEPLLSSAAQQPSSGKPKARTSLHKRRKEKNRREEFNSELGLLAETLVRLDPCLREGGTNSTSNSIRNRAQLLDTAIQKLKRMHEENEANKRKIDALIAEGAVMPPTIKKLKPNKPSASTFVTHRDSNWTAYLDEGQARQAFPVVSQPALQGRDWLLCASSAQHLIPRETLITADEEQERGLWLTEDVLARRGGLFSRGPALSQDQYLLQALLLSSSAASSRTTSNAPTPMALKNCNHPLLRYQPARQREEMAMLRSQCANSMDA